MLRNSPVDPSFLASAADLQQVVGRQSLCALGGQESSGTGVRVLQFLLWICLAQDARIKHRDKNMGAGTVIELETCM